MVFILSTKKIKNGKKLGSLYCKGDYIHEGDDVFVLKGDLFNTSEEEVKNNLKKGTLSITKKKIGEYSFLYYDSKKNSLNLLSDRFGREVIFYYSNGRDFIVSDDFWSVVKLLRIGFDDINIQAIKESLMLFLPLHDETFINNIFTLPAATYINVNLKDFSMSMNTYWSYALKTNKMKKEQKKIDALDKLFERTITEIKEKNGDNKTYGIGVSGGLDSRIMAFYAKKAGLSLQSFIIGEERPHFFFKSRDHKNAQAICDSLDIPHKSISFDNISYHKKMKRDLEGNPIYSTQMFKYVEKLPDFDILLTGVGDMYVGSKIPKNIKHLTREELALEIFKMRGILRAPKSLFRRFLEITKLSPVKETFRTEIKGVVDEKDFQTANRRLKSFLSNKKSRSNYELYQDYVIAVQGSKNKSGAFESLCGKKDSHTIYGERVFDEALTWSEEDHIDRNLLKRFLNEKIPDLASIKSQNWLPPNGKKFGLNFASFLSLSSFILRGWGVMRYPQWSYERRFKRYAKNVMALKSPWFDTIFDKKVIWESYKNKSVDCRMFLQLLKIRVLLEKIRRMNIN